MIGQRLQDPKHVAENPQQLAECQVKISSTMTKLFRQPKNGGNPFLFAFTAPKPHEAVAEIDGKGIGTAATDGKKYYWNLKFLETLTHDEVNIVMQHESYHVIFHHCTRLRGANHDIANRALDYVVNAVIEVDHERNQRPGQLWGGNLGDPLPLKKLLEYIDGKIELPENGKCVYADKSLHGRSPENIYDEIMNHWEKSPRKCKTCGALSLDPKTGQSKIPQPWKQPCCPSCGAKPSGDGVGDGDTRGSGLPGTFDSHINSKTNKQEVQADTMRAAQQASQMRGTVPSEVEDLLGELVKPQIRFVDLVRSAMMRKVQDAGMKNDWKRFRKRYIAAKPRQYLPKRYTHLPKWLCMLDTSGSMGDEDIRYGISQLQVLGNQTEGLIVPVDAAPHWAGTIKVKQVNDLKRTKVIGRGGTTFADFFREFPDKLGKDFDVVIVITDGYCDEIPLELKPRCDVVWVITRPDHTTFKPTFGRVTRLREHHL